MSRNAASLKRRFLIVCEGQKTEYNYLLGFRGCFRSQLDESATKIEVKRGRGKNAGSILNHAINEAKEFKPKPKLGDRVFLLMDTEGADRESELDGVVSKAKKNGIEIVFSCPSFEYWLLCHFPNVPRKCFGTARNVVDELNKPERWLSVCNDKYKKSDEGLFVRVKGKVDLARNQSLEIDLHHLHTSNMYIRKNPSSQVYELIALLLGVNSGDKCPVSSTKWKFTCDKWVVVHDNEAPVEFLKGQKMLDPTSP